MCVIEGQRYQNIASLIIEVTIFAVLNMTRPSAGSNGGPVVQWIERMFPKH